MKRVGHPWVVLAACALTACAARPAPTVAIARPVTASAAPATPAGAPAQPAQPEAPIQTDVADSDQDEGSPDPDDAPPSVGRGWLGVELEPAAPDEGGVRIAHVVPKSPADRAGLVAGDLIQRLDSETVGAPSDVVGLVGRKRAGARVGVAFKRQHADRLAMVTLGAYPEQDEIYRMTFVDQPAPQLDGLKTAQGSFAPSIAAQRGQVLVVEFWAPWCVACRALIPHMNQWHAQYGARGLHVVGITGDPLTRAAAAAKQLGMEYPVASDESGKTIIAYQARAIPAVFVIDRTGTVRDVMVGYDAVRLPKLDALVERLLAER
jgi:peroxiredoxin